MEILIPYIPWLVAMAVLLAISAFFSASEAALFYLSQQQKNELEAASHPGRIAVGLLNQPVRLLTAVLFWNLVVNLLYFALTSAVGIRLAEDANFSEAITIWFSIGSVMGIIFFSEMMPKSLAVLMAPAIATLVAIPLAIAAKIIDPILPSIHAMRILSRRVLFPKFQSESYLEVDDLLRAVKLSKTDAKLLAREQAVLQNIVSISDVRVDELMRPRTQFLSFTPPVSLQDLGGCITPSGYVLVTEPNSEEVASAIALRRLSDVPQEHLEHYAVDVLYVPWSTTVASALEQMQQQKRQVAAVINEFGETIGILTIDDIEDSLFTDRFSRSELFFKRQPIQFVADGQWDITGMTTLRRLARYFNTKLPPSKFVTVAGMLQEVLEHLPKEGDQCRWGSFEFTVIEVPEQGKLIVRMARIDSKGDNQ